MYSFKISFCVVPLKDSRETPCSTPTAAYSENSIGAVALIVILVLTLSRLIPSKRRRISAKLLIATPTRPTSPADLGLSESRPSCVGRSNAVLSPVSPCDIRYLKRLFVSCADPKPVYWRIVQSLARYISSYIPRVNGYFPGSPNTLSSCRGISREVYRRLTGSPESVV